MLREAFFLLKGGEGLVLRENISFDVRCID